MSAELDWPEVYLNDVADEITVGFVGPMADQYRSSGVPFFRSLNIKPLRIETEDLKFISPEFHERIRKSRLKPGDVVIVRTGDPGTATVIPDSFADANCADLVIVRPSERLNPHFLAYYVNAVAHHQVAAHIVGAAQQHFNVGSAKQLTLILPPRLEQDGIAEVLRAYDRKVELNRRMNRTLEDLAAALFRSWFVDFDPVVAKAAGRHPAHLPSELASLFPASFQDSPLGSIPHGWRVATIGDIADNPRRIVDPTSIEATTPYIGLEHMPRKSICLGEWGIATDASSAKTRFQQGEILFGKLRPYFHKVGIALTNGVCSTDVLVVLPKAETWFGVLAGHLSSEEFIDYTDASSGGTRMPRTSWHDMKRYQIVLPPERLAQELSVWYRRAATMITQNTGESRTLAALRDTLLPKLLSGELRVKTAEKLAEAIP